MANRPCVRHHSARPGPGLPAARWTFGQACEPHRGGSAPAPHAANLLRGGQMSMRGVCAAARSSPPPVPPASPTTAQGHP
jgi:hypothetical protein